MYRRGWLRLPKLDYASGSRAGDPDFNRPQYRREDWAFLWILLIIGCTGYCSKRRDWSGWRSADVWDTRWWSRRRRLLKTSRTRPRRGGADCCATSVVFHGLIALVLIALIRTPRSSTSSPPPLLDGSRPLAAQRLPRVPDSQEQVAPRRSPISIGSTAESRRLHQVRPMSRGLPAVRRRSLSPATSS